MEKVEKAHIRYVYNDSRQFRPLDVCLNHRRFVQERIEGDERM